VHSRPGDRLVGGEEVAALVLDPDVRDHARPEAEGVYPLRCARRDLDHGGLNAGRQVHDLVVRARHLAAQSRQLEAVYLGVAKAARSIREVDQEARQLASVPVHLGVGVEVEAVEMDSLGGFGRPAVGGLQKGEGVFVVARPPLRQDDLLVELGSQPARGRQSIRSVSVDPEQIAPPESIR
jgi:hypothetical protein